MNIRSLTSLKRILCKELDGIAEKEELSAGDLETVHKLTDTIKNIDKICMMSEPDSYSLSGDWEMEGKARGKTGYSRSGSKNHFISELESMFDEAETVKEREAILHCIDQLKKA